MTETVESSPAAVDQVRDVLARATQPMTTGEVADAIGRGSRSEVRGLLDRSGAKSRPLSTPGVGRKPEGWARDALTLSGTHPSEAQMPTASTTKKAAKKTARKTAKSASSSRKTAAAAKKRTTRSRTTSSAPRWTGTDYTTADGAPILSDGDGNLYVARPMVEGK